jgi:predicted nucleic-acid-binding Zn-ribbon protein
MAVSTCVKCGSRSFEVKAAEPTGAKFTFLFVQCSSCGSVVGVTEHCNVGVLVRQLAKKLHVNIG